MSRDQRKSKRLFCGVPVDAPMQGGFEGTQTTDISPGGMGFFSRQEIALNSEINIELDIAEDEDPLFVVGRVQWVAPSAKPKGYRVGLSFVNVLHGSKTRLKQYFKEH